MRSGLRCRSAPPPALTHALMPALLVGPLAQPVLGPGAAPQAAPAPAQGSARSSPAPHPGAGAGAAPGATSVSVRRPTKSPAAAANAAPLAASRHRPRSVCRCRALRSLQECVGFSVQHLSTHPRDMQGSCKFITQHVGTPPWTRKEVPHCKRMALQQQESLLPICIFINIQCRCSFLLDSTSACQPRLLVSTRNKLIRMPAQALFSAQPAITAAQSPHSWQENRPERWRQQRLGGRLLRSFRRGQAQAQTILISQSRA